MWFLVVYYAKNAVWKYGNLLYTFKRLHGKRLLVIQIRDITETIIKTEIKMLQSPQKTSITVNMKCSRKGNPMHSQIV